MTVFISGKITGNAEYKKQFNAVAKAYEKANFTVLNPATLPVGLDNCNYADICKAMIDSADMVVFLPTWQDSKGAQLEKAYCRYIDKPNIDLEVKVYDKLLQGL